MFPMDLEIFWPGNDEGGEFSLISGLRRPHPLPHQLRKFLCRHTFLCPQGAGGVVDAGEFAGLTIN